MFTIMTTTQLSKFLILIFVRIFVAEDDKPKAFKHKTYYTRKKSVGEIKWKYEFKKEKGTM